MPTFPSSLQQYLTPFLLLGGQTSLPSSGRSSQLLDLTPFSKLPYHEALSSQKQARIWTQVWPFPCAGLHPSRAGDLVFFKALSGSSPPPPRLPIPGGGAQRAAASRAPSLSVLQLGTLSHPRRSRRDLISQLGTPGCCYFCVTEFGPSKLEGDISSLIGKFKRPLSHSAASGMCN